jgi:UDP-N-acetylmuramate dehydrogenase
VESDADLIGAVTEADARGEPVLVVGGGSNLVVADEGFPGTVIAIATRGIESREGHVTARAGEPWDAFVARMVDEGFAGVECLAGIPGLVGAVPMQNVGAYGQEVSDTIVSVEAWDREARQVVTIPREACGFAYRSSVFRGRDRHVILAVTFAFDREKESRPIRYAELARALDTRVGARAPLETVRARVVSLRRAKGMVLDDADHDTWSAGSFFTNPILDADALARLQDRAPDVPSFAEADGRTKVSAAWLIERAGFAKGYTRGRVAVSTKHALALTNLGGATTEELVDLARAIRAGVLERFGVTLENEPVFVGVRL